VQAEITHKVTARYRSEFANPQTVAAMRMIYNGRIFNISGVLNIDERNRVVVFSVSEGLNNG
jgi:SPP1 family predicted phage head-tail adaptor